MKKEELLKKIYDKTGGNNLADLLEDYMLDSDYNIKLKYKDIYEENGKIIVVVFNKISECQFELIFNEKTRKLEI